MRAIREAALARTLLRVQHARERRARAAAIQDATACASASRAQDEILADRNETARSVADAARARWDNVQGMLLDEAAMTALRRDDAASQQALDLLDEAVKQARQGLVAAEQQREQAAAEAFLQSKATRRRAQLSEACDQRLQRLLALREEATLEDDHAIPRHPGW